MSDPRADRFWSWSLAFYETPGVADACLALQDRDGAEVNIVLLLLWLAAEGKAPLDHAAIADLAAAIEPWRRTVVAPLRQLRRALKGQNEEPLRNAVATAELLAEQATQRRLVAALPALTASAAPPALRAAASLAAHGGLDAAPCRTLVEALVKFGSGSV